MSANKDIIFLISGTPLPAMLEMGFHATNLGKKVAMVILDRHKNDLIIDSSLINYEIVKISVPYKSVELSRFTSIFTCFNIIQKLVIKKLKIDGIIISSSYDLLLFSYLINWKRKYKLRYQVRDLHKFQLSKSILNSSFIFLEKLLLKKVESIIISSPSFYDHYFKKIFKGKVIILENIPLKKNWVGFKKKEFDNNFTIGFIGIIRYYRPLFHLISAVENLIDRGFNISVLFAGGGDDTVLKSKIKYKSNFIFYGPYEYSKDIQYFYSKLDLIYAVYDSDDLNCKLAMPNKFYESIISNIPLLVAEGTFVGCNVRNSNIGRTVVPGNINDLVTLLEQAISNDGWYSSVLNNFTQIDASIYYKKYEDAIKESVL